MWLWEIKMHTLSFKRFCFKSRNDVYKGLKNTEKDQYQKLKVYQNLFFLTCMYIVCNSTNYMPDKKKLHNNIWKRFDYKVHDFCIFDLRGKSSKKIIIWEFSRTFYYNIQIFFYSQWFFRGTTKCHR